MSNSNTTTITFDDGGQSDTWEIDISERKMFLGFPADYPRPDVAVWMESPQVENESSIPLGSTTLYINRAATLTVENEYDDNLNHRQTTDGARGLLDRLIINGNGGAHMQTMTGDRMSHLDVNRARKSEVNDAAILDSKSVSGIGVITPHPCLWKPDPLGLVGASDLAATTGSRPSPTALIQAHNDYRAERGLSQLSSDSALTQAASAHVAWIASTGTVSHTGQGGSSVSDRVLATGWSGGGVGENLAAGQASVEDAMTGWIGSPVHKSNLEFPSWNRIGVGIAKRESGGYYWCVVFGDD